MNNIGLYEDGIFESLLSTAFEKAAETEYITDMTENVSDGECGISEKTDSLILGMIEQSEKKKRVRLKSIIRKSVAAAAVLAIVVVGVRLFVPSAFSTVGKTVSSLKEYISVIFTDKTPNETLKIPLSFDEVEIVSVPDGFEMISEEKTELYCRYTFEKSGRTITLKISPSENLTVAFDNEHGKIEEITVNGDRGWLWLDEESGNGVISFGNSETSIMISGKASRDELISFSRSVDLYKISDNKGSTI